MGINIDRVISATFALGSALAAAGGVLVGIYYNSIDPLMGMVPGIKAFVAAVLGGIGIIPGAMVGGIILGVVEAMVSGFISSTFRDAAAFGILIIILLYKPIVQTCRYFRQKCTRESVGGSYELSSQSRFKKNSCLRHFIRRSAGHDVCRYYRAVLGT